MTDWKSIGSVTLLEERVNNRSSFRSGTERYFAIMLKSSGGSRSNPDKWDMLMNCPGEIVWRPA